MLIGFALALLVVSVVLNVFLLAGWREQSERVRRLERDRRITELEQEFRTSLPAVVSDRPLANILGALIGLWVADRYRYK